MNNNIFELKDLLKYFVTVRKKTGRTILLTKKLEGKFKKIRKGEEELTKKHLKLLSSDSSFSTWWKMPKVTNKDLSKLKGKFIDLEPQCKETIENLLDIIKNIEIVSCVLRFIDPKNYAILSAPVVNLLNIRGKNPVDKYLYYLKDLSELMAEYKFRQIAEVDIALWILTNIINYEKLRDNPEFNLIYKNYSQATNPVKKIMTRNSLLKIKDETPLYKADLLLESDPRLAGILACVEMEKIIDDLCIHNYIGLYTRKNYRKEWISMPKKIDELRNKNVIENKEKEDLKDWWNIRCNLVHGKESKKEIVEIPTVIKGIINLKSKYNSGD